MTRRAPDGDGGIVQLKDGADRVHLRFGLKPNGSEDRRWRRARTEAARGAGRREPHDGPVLAAGARRRMADALTEGRAPLADRPVGSRVFAT